jgi:tetratricopeptide (TPR) repeat protein
LEEALTFTKPKKTRMRYLFVLAQLYLEQKDYDNASVNFRKVIGMNPPYAMTFNATISMATASGEGSTGEVKRQLSKLLKDTKNDEYHDQIYYALAEIEMKEGNTQGAIEYYRKSAAASTINIPQKTKSYLTLANLYYDRRNYVSAQAYYDSATLNMQPVYPNYVQIVAKAKSLNVLVDNLNTVQFQDSVQRIAKMSESDRNRLIEGIMGDLKRKEQAKEESEAIRAQQYANNLNRQSSLPDAKGKAQWYFYNPTTVSQGMGEFQAKWGRRTLEDNWRRKNKGALAEMSFGEDLYHEADTPKISDTNTREYYLQFLPLTDSMMTASHQKIIEALYSLGYIYSNDFGENALAAEQYEELLRRYPQSPYAEASYYYLYQLYTEMGNNSAAETNKNLLISRAPESNFAKILLDPSYLDKLVQEQGEAGRLYEQAYLSYQDGWYEPTIAAANTAIERYPKDVLRPKFAYLRALSRGKLGAPETMRAEMQKIVGEYPKNEVATAAQELIDYIDGLDPSLKKAAQAERVKTLYHSAKGVHYFAWILLAKEDINQLSFDLLNFNLDHYLNTKLDMSRKPLNEKQIILLVSSFSDSDQAWEYYQTFVKDTNAQKNAKNEHTPVIISEENFKILETDKNTEDYIEFFKKEYQRQ